MYSLKYPATVPTVITIVRSLGGSGGGGAGVAAWFAVLWWSRGGFALPMSCAPCWQGLCMAGRNEQLHGLLWCHGGFAVEGLWTTGWGGDRGAESRGGVARLESQENGVAVVAPGLSVVNQRGVGVKWWQDVGVSVVAVSMRRRKKKKKKKELNEAVVVTSVWGESACVHKRKGRGGGPHGTAGVRAAVEAVAVRRQRR
ncbi:hypothetical protein EDB85DRAFT_1895936 [Lactarius pseudohatsudake]|nr:hypothetical protein EDB85DRAFT_1895936 [Lactarius pseudohatsudake]